MSDPQTPPEETEPLEDPEHFIAFEGEMWLIDWKDSPRGEYVTFILQADDETHPFKKYLTQNGAGISTRFFVRMIELGEDDEPINQQQRERIHAALEKREGKGGRISQQAAILCNRQLFQHYVKQKLLTDSSPEQKKEIGGFMPYGIVRVLKTKRAEAFDDPHMAAEICKFYIYAVCKIKTRKDLDHVKSAAMRYRNFVIEPFYRWKDG